MDLLHTKYLIAVELFSRGLSTRPDTINNFAIHLVLNYLLNDYGEELLENDDIPLIRFYLSGRPEDKAKLAWACWKVCEGNPDELDVCWQKLKELWIWRVSEASNANHASDFDQEMIVFAYMLDVAPHNESIITLRPLLEGMLPHIITTEHHFEGWDPYERFLARNVEAYPLQCVQFYRLMREQKKHITPWMHESDEGKKIIELGAANELSRKEALSMVDMLARSGNHQYRYIYDKYTG